MLRPSRIVTAERVSLALGFGLTLLGLLGAQFYLGPAQDRAGRLADDLAKARSQVQILSTAQALDNAFGELGSMIFALNANEASDQDQANAIRALQRRSIDRRHEGVRTYLAQLGLAGVIDYRAMSGAYDKLVADETRELTLATYQAANAFEGDLAMAIVRKSGEKAMDAIRLHSEWVQAERDASRHGLILMAVSMAGLALVFAATLLSEGRGSVPAPAAAGPGTRDVFASSHWRATSSAFGNR